MHSATRAWRWQACRTGRAGLRVGQAGLPVGQASLPAGCLALAAAGKLERMQKFSLNSSAHDSTLRRYR
jgi:hypothetical protein